MRVGFARRSQSAYRFGASDRDEDERRANRVQDARALKDTPPEASIRMAALLIRAAERVSEAGDRAEV